MINIKEIEKAKELIDSLIKRVNDYIEYKENFLIEANERLVKKLEENKNELTHTKYIERDTFHTIEKGKGLVSNFKGYKIASWYSDRVIHQSYFEKGEEQNSLKFDYIDEYKGTVNFSYRTLNSSYSYGEYDGTEVEIEDISFPIELFELEDSQLKDYVKNEIDELEKETWDKILESEVIGLKNSLEKEEKEKRELEEKQKLKESNEYKKYLLMKAKFKTIEEEELINQKKGNRFK